jgi:methylated-DNA-[protein]-cysteine S-methyltransferase
MYEVYHRTPVGVALITADDTHINKVSIRDETVEETITDNPLLLDAIKQLDEYFAGDRKDFDLPLNQPGSDFQQEVWQQLLKYPIWQNHYLRGKQSNTNEQPAGYTCYSGGKR